MTTSKENHKLVDRNPLQPARTSDGPAVVRTLAALALIVCGAVVMTGCGADKAPSALPSQAQFVMHTLADSTGSCGDSAGPCARITLTYPEITEATSQAATDAVNAEIEQLLLQDYADSLDEMFPEDVITKFLSDYDHFLKDFPGHQVPWTETIDVSVVANGGNALSLESVYFAYTGGAHPITLISAHNFDLTDGTQPGLSDLLVPGSDSILQRLGEVYFRKARKLAPGQDLNQAGFWFKGDKFKLPDEFLIDITGLTFIYNAYDIAPYYFGPTEFTIPYSDLRTVLNPSGAAARWNEFAEKLKDPGA